MDDWVILRYSGEVPFCVSVYGVRGTERDKEVYA